MGRVVQAAFLQFIAEEAAEREASRTIGVVVGDENRVTAEAVAIVICLSFVLPLLDQVIGHRIVMDGDEKIALCRVGAPRALEQPRIMAASR
jgi:hypothetical protein